MEALKRLTREILRSRASWRYLVVLLLGFTIDVSLAWVTHTVFHVDLVLAAAFGFLVAMTVSYFAHEFWTFKHPDSAVSAKRVAKFIAASGVTLATRLILVWLSAPLQTLPSGALLRLLFAFAGSLVVGYLVNRLVVFRR